VVRAERHCGHLAAARVEAAGDAARVAQVCDDELPGLRHDRHDAGAAAQVAVDRAGAAQAAVGLDEAGGEAGLEGQGLRRRWLSVP